MMRERRTKANDMNKNLYTTLTTERLPRQVYPGSARVEFLLNATERETETVRRFDIDDDLLERLGIPILPEGMGYYGGAARNPMEAVAEM